MTITYASPLAKAEAEYKTAAKTLERARAYQYAAEGAALSAQTAREQWADQWPAIAARPDRPTYERDGLAVKLDGSPYLTEDGYQANVADIRHPPPPTHEQIDKLAGLAVKAEANLEKVAVQLAKAREAHRPVEKKGYVTVKPCKILGVIYAPGDPIDIAPLHWRRSQLLIEQGMIRMVGVTQ